MVVAAREMHRLELDRQVDARFGEDLLGRVEQQLRAVDCGKVELDDHAARNLLLFFCHFR